MLIKIPVYLILKANIKLSSTLWRTCLVQDYNRVNWHCPYLHPVLCNKVLLKILEFSAIVIEHHKPFLGKRIDIASDGVTGEQAAKILSNESGHRIRYAQIPLDRVRQADDFIINKSYVSLHLVVAYNVDIAKTI